jgi:hypothetical protein
MYTLIFYCFASRLLSKSDGQRTPVHRIIRVLRYITLSGTLPFTFCVPQENLFLSTLYKTGNNMPIFKFNRLIILRYSDISAVTSTTNIYPRNVNDPDIDSKGF